MEDTTLLIHGWSDCSDSFKLLKQALIKKGISKVESIYYGDYESREDSITFDDVVDGFNDEMINWGFIKRNGGKKNNLNVIVHSTGGLVIRHWIWRYYYKNGDNIANCPVKRIVMLAPANFGSPLAHWGKSFLGSLLKGRWKVGDMFETGQNLLDGLELASPYQWQLAHRDCFIPKPYYNAQQIQLTIMVGVKDYQGISGWINKPGTDGTVVIAGTSVDSAKLRLDFSKPKNHSSGYKPKDWQITNPPDDFAFAVLENIDHGDILKQASQTESQVNQFVVEALKTGEAADFSRLQDKLEKVTEQTYLKIKKPKYQQIVFHAMDDQDKPIKDFTIEFNIYQAEKVSRNIVLKETLSKKEIIHSDIVNRALTSEFHKNTKDSSYRSILVDIETIKKILNNAAKDIGKKVILSMTVYVPKVDNGIRYKNHNLQNILIYDPTSKEVKNPSFFYANTTTLVELKIDRFNTYVQIGKKSQKH